MVINMKIFVKTLKEKYKGIVLLSFIFFVFAIFVMAIYPVMGEDLGIFDELFEHPAFSALRKSVITMASLEGFLIMELYQWGIEILLAGYTIFFAASLVAGEIEDKTIDLLLANPVSRTRVLLEKFAALAGMIFLVNIVLLVGVLAGAQYIQEDMNVTWLVYTHILLMPFLLAVGSYATLLSVVFDDARKAFSIGFGILMGSFMVDSISLMSETYAVIGKVTLFHYFDPGKVLIFHEIDWGAQVTLLTVAVILLGVAVVWFKKRDISVV
jgi:ABC-2 type transport system permease protein